MVTRVETDVIQTVGSPGDPDKLRCVLCRRSRVGCDRAPTARITVSDVLDSYPPYCSR